MNRPPISPLQDPTIVKRFGPLVEAEWAVPTALQHKLTEANRPVPTPVAGVALIDTGASHTCIAQDAATELGLRATSVGQTFGAGGRHANETFFARLSFRISLVSGQVGSVHREHTALGIPSLHEQFEHAASRGTIPPTGVPWRLIGLIGRDLLQNMRFSMHGPSGTFEIAIVD